LSRQLLKKVMVGSPVDLQTRVTRDISEPLDETLISQRRPNGIPDQTHIDLKQYVRGKKHEVVVGIIKLLAEKKLLSVLFPRGLVKFDKTETLALSCKEGFEPLNEFILDKYFDLFAKTGISAEKFTSVNEHFTAFYLELGTAITHAPEYVQLAELVNEEALFDVCFPTALENFSYLTKGKDYELIDKWCKFLSLTDFFLQTAQQMQGKTGGLKRVQGLIDTKRQRYFRKVKTQVRSGLAQRQGSLRRLIEELEQETRSVANVIHETLGTDPSNALLLTHLDQAREERKIIIALKQDLDKEKPAYLASIKAILQNVIDQICGEYIRKTSFYKALGTWSPEVRNDFADWLFEIMNDQGINETHVKEEFRVKVNEALSQKSR